MSGPRKIPTELSEWIVRSLDGRSTPEEFTQLEQELATNEAALAYYLEFVTLSVGLTDHVGVLPQSLEGLSDLKHAPPWKDLVSAAPTPHNQDQIGLQTEMSEEEKTRLIEEYAQSQLDAFLLAEHERQQRTACARPQWDVIEVAHRLRDGLKTTTRLGMQAAKTMAACIMLVLALAIAYAMIKGEPKVAVIKETVSARWADPVEVGAELRPQELQLQEGYAKIQLKKGAEVIVQAPASFELQTGNQLFLKNGLMTAVVPEAAKGFIIDTPHSHIVDYYDGLIDEFRIYNRALSEGEMRWLAGDQ